MLIILICWSSLLTSLLCLGIFCLEFVGPFVSILIDLKLLFLVSHPPELLIYLLVLSL